MWQPPASAPGPGKEVQGMTSWLKAEKIINSPNKSKPIEQTHQLFQKPRAWTGFKRFSLHSDADQSLTLSGIFVTIFLLSFKSPQATVHRGSISVNTEPIVNIVTI